MTLTILAQAALWLWFFGCIRTYRIGRILLVEGMGIKCAEFVMCCLYSLGLAAFHALRPVGQWILLAILALWLVIQFMCHWYFTIFGASERKLKGYNDCFRNTIHLVPASDTVLIPDLYHMILHALILINLAVCILWTIR